MAIISISRGSTMRGREVAELVASRLGCRCLSREDVIREAELTGFDETEIIKALDEPPSFLDRLIGDRPHYLAAARAALLNHISDDDVVYHGFAGHFFLKDIAHALKVRILAAMPDRVASVVEHEGVTETEAVRLLSRRDEARRRWAVQVSGVDPEDPTLYDVVLNVGKMNPDEVSQIICEMSDNDPFKSTASTRAELTDLALTASVEAVLVGMEVSLDTVDVQVTDGKVEVLIHALPRTQAGSGPQFEAQYVSNLEHRLRLVTRQITGLKTFRLKHVRD